MSPTPPTQYIAGSDVIAEVDRNPHALEQSISILDEDILWNIFWINTDMNADPKDPYKDHNSWKFRAMTITRHSSQVCRQWRQIILGSPSLWGRVIDLQLLQQRNEYWRAEVFHRIQQSLLYIKGTLRPSSQEGAAFFENLIKTHWRRIREIDVVAAGPRALTIETWNYMKEPAENLQSFKLRLSTPPPPVPAYASFFTNQAPSLRVFHVDNVRFSPQSDWFSKISSLELAYDPISQIAVTRLFEMISIMPDLQHLALRRAILQTSDQTMNSLNTINLPHLSEIVVHERDLRTAIAILEHIRPATGCSVNFRCLDNAMASDWGAELVSRTHVILSRYSKAYFDIHSPIELYIKVGLTGASVETSTDDPSGSYLHFAYEPKDMWAVFHFLSSCRLTTVIFLTIDVRFAEYQPSNPVFCQFLLSLPSVEVMFTTSRTIALFNLISATETAVLFSQMTELKLVESNVNYSYDPKDDASLLDPIPQFLQHRIGIGLPVKVLDLTHCRNEESQQLARRRSLEQFTDLKVIFKADRKDW